MKEMKEKEKEGFPKKGLPLERDFSRVLTVYD